MRTLLRSLSILVDSQVFQSRMHTHLVNFFANNRYLREDCTYHGRISQAINNG